MPGEFYQKGKAEKVDIQGILDRLDHAEYGLAALGAKIGSVVGHIDFWSTPDDVIDLPAAATHIDLPDVEVSGLPGGISLLKVVAILKVRAIENTNAGGPNAINGVQAIRVKKSTGVWGVDDIAAIDLPDNLWTVGASTREGGDVLIGSRDVKSVQMVKAPTT